MCVCMYVYVYVYRGQRHPDALVGIPLCVYLALGMRFLQCRNPQLFLKTRSGELWLVLVLRMHQSVVQIVSFRYFQTIV